MLLELLCAGLCDTMFTVGEHGGVVLVGFKPDLDDQLVSFSAVTDTVGLVIWHVKIFPEVT